jgi:aminopeptidase-like protein
MSTTWTPERIDKFLKLLFPIMRSLTGVGNRETLSILKEIVPLEIKEYPSGQAVYDWEIPPEWSVSEAWIKDANGNKLIDFVICNVHLVGYSDAAYCRLSFEDLCQHLYYREDMPDVIPYRTSYYKRQWGFCVNKAQYDSLAEAPGPLEIYIDSQFDDNGSLSVGELLIEGQSTEEILVSTYICHPSLANDNLSGILLTACLADELLKQGKLRKSYRFIWVPETIGAIAYCANNEALMKQIDHGVVVTTVGGPDAFGYKQSFDTDHVINKLIEQVFSEAEVDFITYPFNISGSDERQYSTQGFRINVATITKGKYYEYPYYHTSKDNLDFVKGEYIAQSLSLYRMLLEKIDQNVIYQNLNPHCEVMLSKHGLYPELGGAFLPGSNDPLNMRKWLLFSCDGETPLLDVVERTGFPLRELSEQADLLVEKGILKLC